MIPPVFHYTGHKFKRLGQLLPLIPKSSFLYEPFCGSGVVGINALDSGLCKGIILNDFDSKVIDLLFYMVTSSNFISEAMLVDSKYEKTKSGFTSLKNDYNSVENSKQHSTLRFAMLYCLICRSFNNQIRFNKSGEFNLPFGDRNRFDLTAIEMVKDKLSQSSIGFMRADFRQAVTTAREDDFVFVDPPYINSTATYNTGWNMELEVALYEWLDGLTARGIRWMLTSTLHNRGKHNETLQAFIDNRDLSVVSLKGTYANSSYHKSSDETTELAVMNYKPEGFTDEQIIAENSERAA